MPVQHRVITIADFLRTDLSGQVNYDQTKQVFADVLIACSQAGVQHVLLDLREASTTDVQHVGDLFSLTMHLLNLAPPTGFRMALLNRPKDGFDRAAIFGECAQEQGLAVAAFRDFEAALLWLNEEPGSEAVDGV